MTSALKRPGLVGLMWITAPLLTLGCALAPSAARTERPSLVVYLVVDQLRADYLTRFHDRFGPDGFRLLMDHGAHFVNARYAYGFTTTAPGHATIATGRQPRQHGIVDNAWPQGRPKPSDKAAVFDPRVKILVGDGGSTEGRSPRNLIGTTLADQVQLADARSRVFTVALKDRAAILLGGKRPDGAFWFDTNVGQFVTSDYYMSELPAYVRDFNQQRWPDRCAGQVWDRLLPEAAYALTRPIDPKLLGSNAGLGASFPHALPATTDKKLYAAIYASPFGHDITIEMARRILVNERPGTGEATDFFAVSLSSFDAAGHNFGPESPEMMDFILRTDRQIAALLKMLDEIAGLEHCLIALTADHGVTTPPQVVEAAGMGEVWIDLAPAIKDLNASLKDLVPWPDDRKVFRSIDLPWIKTDTAFEELEPEKRREILRQAKAALLAVEGVVGVYTSDELSRPAPAKLNTGYLLAWNSYYPGRSAALFVELAPYVRQKNSGIADHSAGTTQGRHVPIVMMGRGIRPGRYFAEADPVDITMTAASLIGIEPPLGAAGRVLDEAVDARAFVK